MHVDEVLRQKRLKCSEVRSCGHRLERIIVVPAAQHGFGDDTVAIANDGHCMVA
jgi:hypothetical protein